MCLALVLAACGSEEPDERASAAATETPTIVSSPASEPTPAATPSPTATPPPAATLPSTATPGPPSAPSSPEPGTVDPALIGPGWWLIEIDGADALRGANVMITFTNDRIVGNDGCNELTGTLLAASNGQLTVVDAGGTDIGCETPVMEQAEQFAEALFNARGYTVDGDELQIMDSNGVTALRLTRQGAPFDAALAANTWVLVEIDSQPALPEPPVTLELAEGHVSGHDGCNTFSGDLILLGDGALDIANLQQTLIGCGPPISEQASRVTGYLSFVTSYHLDGDRLTFGVENGDWLTFAPLDNPTTSTP
jgi:heat shock protein HslJ